VAIKSHPVDPQSGPPSVPEWRIEPAPVAYRDAVLAMEERVAAIRAGTAPELIWLVEHPAVYTAGTSADPAELLDAGNIPVIATGRGGRHTYHGPGQRVTYVMADLRRRGQDVRRFVHALEEWAILSLALLGVTGERRQGRVGIWVPRGEGREDKIVAIGVRVRGWVSYASATGSSASHPLPTSASTPAWRASTPPCGRRSTRRSAKRGHERAACGRDRPVRRRRERIGHRAVADRSGCRLRQTHRGRPAG
jgi:lipoyl(octanoyl) transferase